MIRLSLLAATIFAASSPAFAFDPECTPLPSAASILDAPGLRYLLVGETHGTKEAPGLFADLVCAASSRPLVVGVEWPSANQKILKAFLVEADRSRALALLRTAPALERPDGRGSEAMVEMLMTVWSLKQRGRAIDAVAFDHEIVEPGTSEVRERAMADLLSAAASRHPRALLIALTGTGHADKSGFQSFDPPVKSMVQFLPASETRTIATVSVGGTALVCRRVRPSGEQRCAAAELPVRSEMIARGLTAGRAGFDAVASPGTTYTPSPAGQGAASIAARVAKERFETSALPQAGAAVAVHRHDRFATRADRQGSF